jgi:hypothetical protein
MRWSWWSWWTRWTWWRGHGERKSGAEVLVHLVQRRTFHKEMATGRARFEALVGMVRVAAARPMSMRVVVDVQHHHCPQLFPENASRRRGGGGDWGGRTSQGGAPLPRVSPATATRLPVPSAKAVAYGVKVGARAAGPVGRVRRVLPRAAEDDGGEVHLVPHANRGQLEDGAREGVGQAPVVGPEECLRDGGVWRGAAVHVASERQSLQCRSRRHVTRAVAMGAEASRRGVDLRAESEGALIGFASNGIVWVKIEWCITPVHLACVQAMHLT